VSAEVLAAVKDQPLTGAVASGLTRGVTSTSIKIGCVYTSAFWPNSAGGFAARFNRANAEGGINGRKIEFSGCAEDGQNPDTNLANTKRLVEQEQDFAIMEFSTFATPQVTDYLNAQQVPFLGWGILPGFCGTRWGFGFNGCVVSSGITSLKTGWGQASNLYPIIASGLQFKDMKIAMLGADNDSSRSSFADASKIITANGGKVVYNESKVPLTGVTDFTPYVRPVLAAHPNAVSINIALNYLGQVIAALRAGGYKGVITNPTGYQPGLLQAQPAFAKALEGSSSVSFTTPIEQSTPYNTQMLKDLASTKTPPGQGPQFAYDQADMLVQMLTAAGKDLNTKTFDQAVNGGNFVYKPNPTGGPAALPYPAGHFTGADCTAAMQVVNAKYVVKGEYKCFPSVKTRG
jgi:ABC-type branched-subunit amino acid transport system substrate-binding protein